MRRIDLESAQPARSGNITRRKNHLSTSKSKRRWKPTRIQIRAGEAARERADREAARIPWPQLFKARRDYVRLQGYIAWVRAIEESEGDLPVWLAEVVETHARGYLGYAAECGVRHKHALRPNSSWRLLEEWINEHTFRKPWEEGWMYAVGYYGAKDLVSIRNDTYADWCMEDWKRRKPTRYPSFAEWRSASESVSDEILDHMEMRDDRRELIKLMRRVRPQALRLAVDKYVDWKIFALWTRAALEELPRLPGGVEQTLQIRSPGFLEQQAAVRHSPRALDLMMQWIEDRYFERAKYEGWFDVLLYEADLHPRHARAKDYWIDWEYEWTREGRLGYPSLETWTQALDRYTFKPQD